MSIKIAINGFGRIGQAAFKIALEKPELEIVAINGLSPMEMTAQLFKHDSVYGIYAKDVKWEGEEYLVVDGKKYRKFSEKDPLVLPWKDLGIDVVLECTGKFVKKEDAELHLKAGAKRVIISAPAKGDNVPTYVIGVNQDKMDHAKDSVISNASCTTNCIAALMKVVDEAYGIEKALMTTIHSYTADQNLVDGSHKKDIRRARAAALNMVPTSTGAAKAVGLVVPTLKGIFDGLAIRVPVACGSLSDITMLLKKETSVEELNKLFTDAEQKAEYKGIITTTTDPIVSSDVVGNPASTVIDLPLTKVMGGNLVKVIAWYDNEWGYSNRLVEQAIEIGKEIK